MWIKRSCICWWITISEFCDSLTCELLCFSTHNMLQQKKKLPRYGIPAFLKKTKTRNRKVNRMGNPCCTWQERGYHHLPDTTLPVSQGRPCVRWWPSKQCWGHLESHSGRIGLKPLVMQPVQRRSEIKILKYLELSQHIAHSPPTRQFVNTTDWLYYSWYQAPAAM